MDVRIIHLEPMRVASVLGYGKEPEKQAWDKMLNWAESHLQLEKPHRAFGFNNPSPSPGNPNYGYEVWLTIGDDVQSDDAVTVKEFPGGDYAVTRHTGMENIPDTWMQLSTWVETSSYRKGSHQWLEEHIGLSRAFSPENFALDLYLPIRK